MILFFYKLFVLFLFFQVINLRKKTGANNRKEYLSAQLAREMLSDNHNISKSKIY